MWNSFGEDVFSIPVKFSTFLLSMTFHGLPCANDCVSINERTKRADRSGFLGCLVRDNRRSRIVVA